MDNGAADGKPSANRYLRTVVYLYMAHLDLEKSAVSLHGDDCPDDTNGRGIVSAVPGGGMRANHSGGLLTPFL